MHLLLLEQLISCFQKTLKERQWFPDSHSMDETVCFVIESTIPIKVPQHEELIISSHFNQIQCLRIENRYR